MKKFIFIILGLFFLLPISVDARSTRTSASDVYVKGYTRKDGTYVAPYYRTRPNNTLLDNYSCIDNGRCGTGTSGSIFTNTIPSQDSSALTDIKEKVTTHSCQVNASWNGSGCSCNNGYFEENAQCIAGQDFCTKNYGSDAYFNPGDLKCHYCTSGYILDIGSDVCRPIVNKPTIPPQPSQPFGNVLGVKVCSYGYGWNDYLQTCIALAPGTESAIGSSGLSDNTSSASRFVITKWRVNIRQFPLVNSEKISIVPANSRFELLGDNGEWVKVSYGKSTGWIRKDLVTIE